MKSVVREGKEKYCDKSAKEIRYDHYLTIVQIQPLVRGRRNPISLTLIKVTKVLVSQESLLITLPRVKEKRNQMKNLAIVSRV